MLAIAAVSLFSHARVQHASDFAAEPALLNVTPTSGTPYPTFGFAGRNLVPGLFIHICFVSPDGSEHTWANDVDGRDGERVDRYGTIYLNLRSVDDFPGGTFGVWEAHFITDIGDSGMVTFSVVRCTTDLPSG